MQKDNFMRAAVIDLGTNTFHLVIADLSDQIKVLYKTNIPVKLGEGRINDNIIIPEAFERGLQALKQFSEQIDRYQIKKVKATATSAIRSALNGTDFVKAAKERSGIDIEVISGDREAEYIFKGVQASGAVQKMSLIMDIGGGSTEFILCSPDELFWKKSYNLGAARLMQAYFKSDPISKKDQSLITKHLDAELSSLKEACNKYQPEILIGSAGAFETFATMILKDPSAGTRPSCSIPLEGYKKLSSHLITSTHAERSEMEGLIPLRVDMIVLAVLLTNYVFDKTGLKKIELSSYDLKMGVLYHLLQTK